MPKKLEFGTLQVIVMPVIAMLASLDFGCVSSHITNMWKDPEFTSPPMTNVLVIAAKNNPVNRRLWEDEIVAALSAYGVSSVCSYRLFADSIPNPNQVGTAVREKKFDGVLFIRGLPTEISTTYVPGGCEERAGHGI